MSLSCFNPAKFISVYYYFTEYEKWERSLLRKSGCIIYRKNGSTVPSGWGEKHCEPQKKECNEPINYSQ